MTRKKKKEFKERRLALFMKLGDMLKPIIAEHPETGLYILDLWRYIADEHEESFSVEVDK